MLFTKEIIPGKTIHSKIERPISIFTRKAGLIYIRLFNYKWRSELEETSTRNVLAPGLNHPP
jgi:hypothetical protein